MLRLAVWAVTSPTPVVTCHAQELMRVPVIAADGISYEKEAIRRWFAMGQASSPWTNQPLPTLQLIPNRAVGMPLLLGPTGSPTA